MAECTPRAFGYGGGCASADGTTASAPGSDSPLADLKIQEHEGPLHLRPVFLVHGALDNVIHHSEMDRLVEHLHPSTPRAAYRTGLKSHTVGAKGGGGLGYMFGEIRTMLHILRAMHAASRQPTQGR